MNTETVDLGTSATIQWPPQPAWLTLANGVRISLTDGTVELNGVDPDEAAKAFWAAITRNFPTKPTP